MKTFKIFIIAFLPFYLNAQSLVEVDVKGSPNQYINFLLVAEGYLAADSAQFVQDVETITGPLFSTSPIDEYKNFFNVYGLWKTSAEEGSDHPGNAGDEPTGCGASCHPIKTVNTAYHTTYDFSGIHRLIYTSNPQVLLDALVVLPQVDVILIIVNETEYGGAGDPDAFVGGGGPFYGTTSLNNNQDLSIHEFGHTFAELQDEYCAGTFEAPNMTQETNPSLIKWKNWIGSNGIGIYNYPNTCTSNTPCQSWRIPHQNCKMGCNLANEFCSVCKEAIIDKCYDFAVDPIINKFYSVNPGLTFNNDDEGNFGVNVIYPEPNTLCFEWEINGVTVPSKTDRLETFHYDDFDIGSNNLKLIVTDKTDLSRSYLPADGYVFERNWTVMKEDLCISTSTYFGDKHLALINSIFSLKYQMSDDDFNWTYNEGGTPTPFTGPNAGHFDGYMYAEADGNSEGDITHFRTVCYDLRRAIEPEFEFHYHMFSGVMPDRMGTLEVYGTTHGSGDWVLLRSFSGNQGNSWNKEVIDLSSFIGESSISFRFRAIRGSGSQSDIAIDGMVYRDVCQDDELTLSGDGTTDNSLEVTDWIKSTVNILPDRTVYYDAIDFIELNAGFEVQSGAVFEADFGKCEP